MSNLTDRQVGELAGAILGQHRRNPQPRTITIICRGKNDFDVFEGEDFCNRLCWDEMLGQIVHLTHPSIKSPRYGMTDVDRYQLYLERHRRAAQRPEAEDNARAAEAAGDTEAALNARASAWREEQGLEG